jgi:hypothetical protein
LFHVDVAQALSILLDAALQKFVALGNSRGEIGEALEIGRGEIPQVRSWAVIGWSAVQE